MSFRLRIAATREDWIGLLGEVNGGELLQFYPMVAPSREDIAPVRLENLPGLGTAKSGILVQEESYLALPATERAVPREIRQNNGDIRYVLDQLTHPDSLIFRPGGLWQSDCYLIGEIASLHDFGLAVKAAKKLKSVVKKRFYFREAYWIGPECHSLYPHCTFTTDCRYPT